MQEETITKDSTKEIKETQDIHDIQDLPESPDVSDRETVSRQNYPSGSFEDCDIYLHDSTFVGHL